MTAPVVITTIQRYPVWEPITLAKLESKTQTRARSDLQPLKKKDILCFTYAE